MRRLAKIGLILLVLYLTALAGFAFAMRLPVDRFAMLMSHTGPVPFLLFPFETLWKDARAGRLKVGDPAPDFTLPLLDRSLPDRSGSIRLSSFQGVRPVVLVFGSYT
jgi:hypothetical protein